MHVSSQKKMKKIHDRVNTRETVDFMSSHMIHASFTCILSLIKLSCSLYMLHNTKTCICLHMYIYMFMIGYDTHMKENMCSFCSFWDWVDSFDVTHCKSTCFPEILWFCFSLEINSILFYMYRSHYLFICWCTMSFFPIPLL